MSLDLPQVICNLHIYSLGIHGKVIINVLLGGAAELL